MPIMGWPRWSSGAPAKYFRPSWFSIAMINLPSGLSSCLTLSSILSAGLSPGVNKLAYSKTPMSVTTSNFSVHLNWSNFSASTVTLSRSRVRERAMAARRGLPSSANTWAPLSPKYRVIAPQPAPISRTRAFL